MNNAWSFSKLKAYQTCPRQYLEIKVLKHFQETVHPTTAWGTRGHEALEFRIRDGMPLPDEFAYLEPLAQTTIAIPGDTHCELELACTRDRSPTGFNDEDAWSRGIIDVFKFQDDKAVAVDWKFGKVKPTSQLKLNALLIFANYPTVQVVKTRFLWIAAREKTDGTYHRRDEDSLWEEFERDSDQLIKAHEEGLFPAKSSGLCKPNGKGYAGCVVSTCEFWGKGGRR